MKQGRGILLIYIYFSFKNAEPYITISDCMSACLSIFITALPGHDLDMDHTEPMAKIGGRWAGKFYFESIVLILNI